MPPASFPAFAAISPGPSTASSRNNPLERLRRKRDRACFGARSLRCKFLIFWRGVSMSILLRKMRNETDLSCFPFLQHCCRSYHANPPVASMVGIRLSVLAGESGEKFMQSSPVKCANEDAADCDSRMLDASWLWCDYSCLPQSHWKDASLAETGKRREFLVSNS